MNDSLTTYQIAGLVLIVMGVLFDLSGCIGLVRLPDVYNRIQASTKCVVLGTVMILLGAVICLGSIHVIVKGLICILFISITSATAAHALSRAAHRSGVPLADCSIVDRYARDQKPDNEPQEGAL